MISDRDAAFYHEHGYLVVPGVLEQSSVESLRQELDAIVEGARGVTAHSDVYDLEPGHRPDAPRVRRISFHHVRLLHGSAQNVSDWSRALLLYEYAAADAWPLLGVKDPADFDRRLVTGEPSVEARVRPAPVRMPLPPAIHQGSIYENQSDASRRYFAVAPASAEAVRT
jgi:hypothetical protein